MTENKNIINKIGDMSSDEIFKLKSGISKKVDKLTKDECMGLLNIIELKDIKKTVNNNGTFVNLTTLDDETFAHVHDYIEYCYEMHKDSIVKDEDDNFGCFFNENNKNGDFLDQFNQIKNSKKLNSLEKSVIRNNIHKAIVDTQEDEKERIFQQNEGSTTTNVADFFRKRRSSSKKSTNKSNASNKSLSKKSSNDSISEEKEKKPKKVNKLKK